MIKEKKVTEEELKQIKDIQEKQRDLITTLGINEYQLKYYKEEKEVIFGEIKKIEQELQKLSEQLKEKYGDVTINMETGEF
tara:strand:+ start:5662 stop:5904 length:243 start_codon:yes stop_codon:yes gene_type:complete